MTDAPQQAAIANRERIIILATDITGKTTILTPRPRPGIPDEDYLNGLRAQMANRYTTMHYTREAITYEPLPDTGPQSKPDHTTDPYVATATMTGMGSLTSPTQTFIEFPAEWAR